MKTTPFQRHNKAGESITRAMRAAERADCGDAVVEALMRAKLALIEERRARFEPTGDLDKAA